MKRLVTLTVAHLRAQIKGAMPPNDSNVDFTPLQEQPVSNALMEAYLVRLEIQVTAIGKGKEALRQLALDHPNLAQELNEMETWILGNHPRAQRHAANGEWENHTGDRLIAAGHSFTEAKKMIDELRRKMIRKGAPNKRAATLEMMNARVRRGLSYPQLAAQMCDCEKKKHDAHCSDSIRKRIKELEAFLDKYKIVYRESRLPPEKSQR